MASFTHERFVIKVCGVTSRDDAELVVSAGATALGLIVTDSPRRVSVERAADIATALRGRIARVVVMRDVNVEDVRRVLDVVDVDAIQVHGGLRRGVADAVRDHDVALVEALTIDNLDARSTHADVYLLDGPRPGSGETHGWHEVTSRAWDRPVIVAGGLTSHNVADVLREVRPWGCDVATGSESSPGIKDRAKVESFVHVAREYFESREDVRD